MFPSINEMMLAVSQSLAVSIIVKATLTVILGLTAAWLARGQRAALRHAWLAATFGVLLALPAAALLTPAVRITLLAEVPQNGIPASVSYLSPSALPLRRTPPRERLWATGLVALWICGVVTGSLRFSVGLWQIRALRRSARPWREGQTMVDEIARAAGIQRPVETLLQSEVPGPMTCGAFHPAILLPDDAMHWMLEDLQRALTHELEHVRRYDWLSQSIAHVACAAYWFHPLVWMAWRRLQLEAERACDDAVLRKAEATAYAGQLVELAKRLHAGSKLSVPAMASRSDLAARVASVLDRHQPRGRAGKAAVSLACVATITALAIAPVRMVAAPQSGPPIARFAAAGALVIEDVYATDPAGNAIANLTSGDFTLTEDGVVQRLSMFQFLTVDSSTQGKPAGYYLLGYYTNNNQLDGVYHQIKIACPNPIVTLDYRPGYYAVNRFRFANDAAQDVPGTSPSTGAYQPPRIVHKYEPEYSEEARKAKYQGHIELLVTIDATGLVAQVQVQKSLGLGLDEKAAAAVRQWLFKPATQNGNPVPAQVAIGVDFRLL